MARYGPPEDTLYSVINPTTLPALCSLKLDLPRMSPSLELERFYPLFSKLEELDIRGDWYHAVDHHYLDSFEGTAAVYPSTMIHHTPNLSWRLKKLTIDKLYIPFLYNCAASLGVLSLKHPPGLGQYTRWGGLRNRPYRRRLPEMPNLRSVTVENISDSKEEEFRAQGSMGLDVLWEKVDPYEPDWTLGRILAGLI